MGEEEGDYYVDDEVDYGGTGADQQPLSAGGAESDAPAALPKAPRKCPLCGCTEFSREVAGLSCTQCGNVVEDGAIVNEVAFAEGSGGRASALGGRVGESGHARFRSASGASTVESRENTMAKAREQLSRLANLVRLNHHHVDAALRLFGLALQTGFCRGRRSANVITACIYIVCRREQTPHMLVDLADVQGLRVYTLGHTFMRLCRVLKLKIPLVDPSLYIHRFAAQLEFEGKTLAVGNTALRLVQRMGRDWIHTGRRPSGICGAALLIAARLHGFERSLEEVKRIVKIGDGTLQKRLGEFEETEASFMQFDELDDKALQQAKEADPPCFVKAIERDKRKHEEQEQEDKLLEERRGELEREITELEKQVDHDENEKKEEEQEEEKEETEKKRKHKHKKKEKGKDKDRTKVKAKCKDKRKKKDKVKDEEKENQDEDKTTEERKEKDGEVEDVEKYEEAKKGRKRAKKGDKGSTKKKKFKISEFLQHADHKWKHLNPDKIELEMRVERRVAQQRQSAQSPQTQPQPQSPQPQASEITTHLSATATPAKAVEATPAATFTPSQLLTAEDEAVAEEQPEKAQPEDFEDVDDAELDVYLTTQDEAKVKEQIWLEMNCDFLKEQAAKKAAKAAGDGEKPKCRRTRKSQAPLPDTSATDAVRELLRRKAPSSKVNWSALDKLMDIDGGSKKAAPAASEPSEDLEKADDLHEEGDEAVTTQGEEDSELAGAWESHDPSEVHEVAGQGALEDDGYF
eukprot:TRINITY_DN3213_c0_g1_i3.p1 TRINITY_DN3213_c0_g1~~TRINITY_DN3213_c0_g1_i3.p1  ORF type:complete len:748 (+),score=248.82 TRINITY_DN3213_c0_g1_i3:55-2298(+)